MSEVAHRLILSEQNRQLRLKARRDEAAEAARVYEEAVICLTRKRVSSKEARKTTERLHDESVKQRALKAHEREKARVALEALRDGVCESTFQPRLSRAATSRRSLQRVVRVEDRLAGVAARLMERRRTESLRAKVQAAADARPRITTKAAALDRTDLDVSNRLYLDARISALKKKKLRKKRVGSARKVATSARESETRGHALFLDAKRREESIKSTRENEARRDAAKTKVPISKGSERLAAKQTVTPAERLMSEKSRKQRLIAEITSAAGSSSTYNEETGGAATPARRQRRVQSHRVMTKTNLFDEARRAANRRKAKKIESDLSELDGCTFQPDMSLSSESPASLLLLDEGDISTRSQDWLRKRNEKLEILLRAKQRDEVEGCTFSPTRIFAKATMSRPVPLGLLQARLCEIWGTQPSTTKLMLFRCDDWTNESFDEDVYVDVRAKGTSERTREFVLQGMKDVQQAFKEHSLTANVRLETYQGDSYFHVPPPVIT